MGMGEPLQNYEAVLKSVHIINHPQGKNIGLRHLTISTCGIADAIRKLADEDIHPRLAISLNAPNDTLRSKIMPINKKHPIAALLAAVKYYQLKTELRVTFEYVLIKDLNDSTLHAQMLARLVHQVKCNINLIEFNPHPLCSFAASGRQTIKRFAEILGDAGIETTIRFKKGWKIKAACGQLGADLLRQSVQNSHRDLRFS
jgi:23S rRNA (adenine2503-C2)-methyltransferase